MVKSTWNVCSYWYQTCDLRFYVTHVPLGMIYCDDQSYDQNRSGNFWSLMELCKHNSKLDRLFNKKIDKKKCINVKSKTIYVIL